MEWRSRSPDKFTGNLMEHMQKVRNIENMDEFLNPSSNNVHSPLLLKNIRQAIERVMQGVSNDEKIVVVADP